MPDPRFPRGQRQPLGGGAPAYYLTIRPPPLPKILAKGYAFFAIPRSVNVISSSEKKKKNFCSPYHILEMVRNSWLRQHLSRIARALWKIFHVEFWTGCWYAALGRQYDISLYTATPENLKQEESQKRIGGNCCVKLALSWMVGVLPLGVLCLFTSVVHILKSISTCRNERPLSKKKKKKKRALANDLSFQWELDAFPSAGRRVF